MDKVVLDRLAAIEAPDQSKFVREVARVFEGSDRDASAVLIEPISVAELTQQICREGFQVMGQGIDNMVVLISVREIAEILAATRRMSFGEALDTAGFTPINRKLKIGPAVDHFPVLRRPGRQKPCPGEK